MTNVQSLMTKETPNFQTANLISAVPWKTTNLDIWASLVIAGLVIGHVENA
jgi:hypothetical protein